MYIKDFFFVNDSALFSYKEHTGVCSWMFSFNSRGKIEKFIGILPLVSQPSVILVDMYK